MLLAAAAVLNPLGLDISHSKSTNVQDRRNHDRRIERTELIRRRRSCGRGRMVELLAYSIANRRHLVGEYSTMAASPSACLRKSTGRVATRTWRSVPAVIVRPSLLHAAQRPVLQSRPGR